MLLQSLHSCKLCTSSTQSACNSQSTLAVSVRLTLANKDFWRRSTERQNSSSLTCIVHVRVMRQTVASCDSAGYSLTRTRVNHLRLFASSPAIAVTGWCHRQRIARCLLGALCTDHRRQYNAASCHSARWTRGEVRTSAVGSCVAMTLPEMQTR